MSYGWATARRKARSLRDPRKNWKRRFRLPSGFRTGAYRIHASYRGMEVAIPTELRVSNLPEVTVKQAPLELAKALPVSPSAVLNGAIEQPGASHYFRFEARAGETFVFRAESMKLGYHLDPTITVLDAEGETCLCRRSRQRRSHDEFQTRYRPQFPLREGWYPTTSPSATVCIAEATSCSIA